MRASGEKSSRRASGADVHISGAEQLSPASRLEEMVQEYLSRALTHPRGKAGRIVITLEKLNVKPLAVRSLPVATVSSTSSPAEAVQRLLCAAGVSARAIRAASNILQVRESMRGASLMRASSGRRLEPDQERGVRASRLGIAGPAEKKLSASLSRCGIDTPAVREALTLASKVAACPEILAEVCISDDPDYTTGYVAAQALGYIRIPDIKKKGSRSGGRVFFLQESADPCGVIAYLEQRPVIITKVAPCRGEIDLDEILGRSDQ